MSSRSMNAGADISSPKIGQQVHCPFVVGMVEEKEARNKKKFRNIRLRNKTGEISSRVWEERFDLWEGVEPGSPVMITGRIEEGFPKGTMELVVQNLALLEVPHPVQNYLNPVYPGDLEELKAEFEATRLSIKHPGYRLFFDKFFETACPKERFFTCPAARSHHHAYIGGLLEHSLEVKRLWLSFADQPPIRDLVSRDLGIVGSMIHDAGKIHEYVWEGVPIDMSPDSLLFDHITMGPLMIQQTMEQHRAELEELGFTRDDVKFLIHMVVSHHGKQEWGSPTPPAMIEAQLLHQADNMSAQVRGIAQLAIDNKPDRHGKINGPGYGDLRHGIRVGPSLLDPISHGPDNLGIQAEPPLEPSSPRTPVLDIQDQELEEMDESVEQALQGLPGLYEGPIGENLRTKGNTRKRH